MVEPGAGVGAGGLAGVAFFEGVAVSGLYQRGCDTVATEFLWYEGVDDVEDLSPEDICEVGGIAFGLDFEASGGFVMGHFRFHRIISLPEKDILLRHEPEHQKGCRYFFMDS